MALWKIRSHLYYSSNISSTIQMTHIFWNTHKLFHYYWFWYCEFVIFHEWRKETTIISKFNQKSKMNWKIQSIIKKLSYLLSSDITVRSHPHHYYHRTLFTNKFASLIIYSSSASVPVKIIIIMVMTISIFVTLLLKIMQILFICIINWCIRIH